MNIRPPVDTDDSFDLERFTVAQAPIYDTALAELHAGCKQTHWMWFIFPQLAGLGSSATARHFAIHSLEEAEAYLHHPVLGPRLIACCRATLAVQGRTALEILGTPDDLKLRSSMTLFSLVPGAPPEFRDVLRHYYADQPDPRTIDLLQPGSRT